MGTKGVRIISGSEKVNSKAVVGASVASLRADYADILNIPADASVTVNGKTVPLTTKLSDGDEVVFSRPLGQKGA